MNTTVLSLAAQCDGSTVVSLPPDQALPPGLHILSLDDSAVAQKSLKCVLEAELPDAAVATYGKGIEEVDTFMQAALARGDIIIVDQHVDFPGHRLRGTSIVAELIARGYTGFACIRSGDAEEADIAKSKASGAYWHVGKEVPIRTMLQELGREYHRFLQRSSLDLEGPSDVGRKAVSSSSSMPANGSLARPGVKAVASSSSMPANGSLARPGVKAVALSSSMPANGSLARPGVKAVSSSSSMPANGSLARPGVKAVASSSSMPANGSLARPGLKAVASSSSMPANGSLARPGVGSSSSPLQARRSKSLSK